MGGRRNILADLWQDLRYAARTLRKDRGFTITAVLTLALGIGATTGIFSVINGVLLRSLPYKDPHQLVMLWTDDRRHEIHEALTSYPNFEDRKKQSRLFEDMAIFSKPTAMNLTSADETERIVGERVSPNLFSLLGVPPLLGQYFSSEQADNRERVVMLSYGLWLRRFGGATDVVGKSLEIDGKSSRIVGVMPAAFEFPSSETQLWEPHSLEPRWNTLKSDRYFDWWRVVGRLKQTATAQQAQVEMNAISDGLAKTYAATEGHTPEEGDFAGFGINVVPLITQVTGKETPFALSILLAAVLLVLLIACANVASLQLARGAARARELAIRTALGASSYRLIRQLLTEGVLVVLVAGVLGLLLTAAGIRTLVALGPASIPRLSEINISGAVLVFAGGVSVLATVLCTLAPAWMISRCDPNDVLKEGGRSLTSGSGAGRTRNFLVIAEFALAVVLVSGAGLLIRSFLRVISVDLGFRPERVLVVQIDFPQSKTDAQVTALYQQVIDRVAALPGVLSVGAISEFFIQNQPNNTITAEGERAPSVGQLVKHAVNQDFFRAIGAELLRGRYFTSEDFRETGRDGYRVAIVNESMAHRIWPDVDPIGKRFKDGGPASTDPWLTVVGVVRDMRRQGLEREPILQAFVPHMSWSSRNQHLLVLASSDSQTLAASIREVVKSVDKTMPLYGVTTAERSLSESVSQRQFQTLLLALFSLVALVLALVGIYGLVNYSITQRTHEIGVRIALGAQSGDVVGMVLRQGMRLAGTGIALGLGGGLVFSRLLHSLLFGIGSTDPVTFLLTPVLLTAVAVLACYLPARRAMHINPIMALRSE
jgi:putative ABC transport system permease protein